MTQTAFVSYVEDRIALDRAGFWRVETRLLDDDAPSCWHELDGLLSRQQAENMVQRRADLRARTPKP